jgi:hypothetical protein
VTNVPGGLVPPPALRPIKGDEQIVGVDATAVRKVLGADERKPGVPACPGEVRKLGARRRCELLRAS